MEEKGANYLSGGPIASDSFSFGGGGRGVQLMLVVAADTAVGVVGVAVRALRIPRPHWCSPHPPLTSGADSSRSSESYKQILYDNLIIIYFYFYLFIYLFIF